MWHTVLFDLDGVLIDPIDGIENSAQYALRAVGKEEPDLAKLRDFGSEPLRAAFANHAALTEEETDRAVNAYSEYYSARGAFQSRVYPMIPEMLYTMKRSGFKIAAVTSRETQQALRILQQFDLARFFDAVVGVNPGSSPVTKKTLIEQALIALGMQYGRGNVVLVGDRFYDVEGAKEAGISSIGVTYGYGSAQELRESGADYVAENAGELGRLLLKPGAAGGKDGSSMTFLQRFGQIAVPLLLWFGITNLVAGIGGGIYGVIRFRELILSNPDPTAAAQQILEALNSADMGKINMILSGVANVVLIPIMFAVYKKDIFRTTGRKTSLRAEKKPGWFNAVITLLMGFSISTVMNVLIALTGIDEWMYEMNPSRYDMFASVPLWIEFIIICLLAPVVEELLFRAVIFRRVRRFSSYIGAAFISAALFGIVHFDVVTGLCAFIIGVFMAMIYEYTQSIFTSMFFHFGFNFYSIAVALMGLDKLSESAAGIVTIVFFVVNIIVMFATFYVFMRRNRNQA